MPFKCLSPKSCPLRLVSPKVPSMNLDNFYTHCENAIQCQAADNTLGVTAHLMEAAKVRDFLIERARVRLEFGLIRGVLDYWEGVLASLPYAKNTGKAAIYIPQTMEPSDVDVYSATLGLYKSGTTLRISIGVSVRG